MESYRPKKRWFLALLVSVFLLSFANVGTAQSGTARGDAEADVPDDLDSPPVIAQAGVDVALAGTNEQTIAVNPLNQTNFAVASLFSLRVTTNNGVLFSAATPAVVPAATHVLCGDPSLGFDSQGRLFWTYLGCRRDNMNADVFLAQVGPTTGAILAGYPINVTAAVGLPASVLANGNDKEWLAVDHTNGSPFQDRLYIVWTRFITGTSTTVVHTTFSTNQGLTWSAPLAVSLGAEGFVWPVHNAVARNGDVYVAYHSQPNFAGGVPDGATGQIVVLRSTNGGAAYPQRTLAFAPGFADITFNVQGLARALNGSISWTQGSGQPWVLPDPVNPTNVYVVAADDPTNTVHGGTNDDMNVYLVRSTNQGLTWSAPVQVNDGPVGATQFFPTAAIADDSRCVAVSWYDTRNGARNSGNHFLLDVFMRASTDGGVTFGPEVQINDATFDPDLGATARFNPPPTLRIGEYTGIAVVNGIAHRVWTGNTATGQQTFYDNVTTRICPITVPVDVHPQSCPNPFNVNSPGVIPAAILGTSTFDVTLVNASTVKLQGVPALRSSLEDDATPFFPLVGRKNATDCNDFGPDGFIDLNLKFDSEAVAAALGTVTDGQVLNLTLTGQLNDGTPIVGEDIVKIVKKK